MSASLRLVSWRMVTGAGLLLFWWTAGRALGSQYVPDPFAVWWRLIADTESGLLVRHAASTLVLAAAGLFAGTFCGVAVPLLLHRFPRLGVALEPYILASGGVPKYALMPMLVLWFGIGEAPKLWLIALLVFYPVFAGVSTGIRQVDPRLVDVVRVLGASDTVATRLVVWQTTWPFAAAALQIAVPRAVSGTVVAECLLRERGLGFLIEEARQNFDTVGIFVALLTAMLLVFVTHSITGRLSGIDRRRWRGSPVEVWTAGG